MDKDTMDSASIILIVDDNPAIRGALGKLLSVEGYNVAFAGTGVEALSQAADLTPDLILMDVMMPDMDGLTACRRLRADPLLAEVPIIILTALADRASRLQGFEAGADDYVSKPVDDTELLARVRTTTRLNRYRRLLLEQIRRRQVEDELETERKVLRKRTYDLGERVKELNCLFSISNLVEERGVSLEAILEGSVDLIPPAWQYPEITCARLVFKDSEFETENFKVTTWKQASDIVVHSEPSGAVEVYYLEELPESDEGPFLKEERKLINAIAERLGRVIERMQAEEAVRQHAERLSVLYEIDRAILQAESPQNIAQATLNHVQRLIPCQQASVVVLDDAGHAGRQSPQEATVLAAYGAEPRVGDRLTLDLDVLETLRQNKVIVVEGTGALAQVSPGIQAQVRSFVNVPLVSRGKLFASLILGSHRPAAFSSEQIDIAREIADPLAIALQQARLHEQVERHAVELEQRVANRTQELQTLYNVTAIANESLDLEVVLGQALEQSLATVKCRAGMVQLLDEEEKMLHMIVQRGISPHVADLLDTLPASDSSLSSCVIERGKPLVVPDMSVDQRVPLQARAHVPNPYVGVPMRIKGKVVGVLSIVGREGQQFSPEEVSLLASVADHVAAAVENTRLRQRAERAAVMEERGRLARELHDSVTQLLYSLSLFAETGRRLAGAGEWQSAEDYLGQIGQTAQQALKEMRMLIHELRPPVLEQVGLTGALQQRMDAVERRIGVKTSLVVDGTLELSPSVEKALYHIAQEALNNALRHAVATSVRVHIRAGDDCVEMEVMDDGKGFDPDAVGDIGGMGMIGMRERVERLGGELTILSDPGAGSRVRVTIGKKQGAGTKS
ncbi:MAG: GAF domain-containing protein [Chloroflexi bacterium]|nr:GAF domain-containing protein [Chloroflexota bacterium]